MKSFNPLSEMLNEVLQVYKAGEYGTNFKKSIDLRDIYWVI